MRFRRFVCEISIFLSLALLALATACGPDAEQATGPKPLPDSAFKVEWGAATVPPSMKPGEKVLVSVTFKNTSSETWPDPKTSGATPVGAGAVRLSYRWWTPGTPLPTPYAIRA